MSLLLSQRESMQWPIPWQWKTSFESFRLYSLVVRYKWMPVMQRIGTCTVERTLRMVSPCDSYCDQKTHSTRWSADEWQRGELHSRCIPRAEHDLWVPLESHAFAWRVVCLPTRLENPMNNEAAQDSYLTQIDTCWSLLCWTCVTRMFGWLKRDGPRAGRVSPPENVEVTALVRRLSTDGRRLNHAKKMVCMKIIQWIELITYRETESGKSGDFCLIISYCHWTGRESIEWSLLLLFAVKKSRAQRRDNWVRFFCSQRSLLE